MESMCVLFTFVYTYRYILSIWNHIKRSVLFIRYGVLRASGKNVTVLLLFCRSVSSNQKHVHTYRITMLLLTILLCDKMYFQHTNKHKCTHTIHMYIYLSLPHTHTHAYTRSCLCTNVVIVENTQLVKCETKS